MTEAFKPDLSDGPWSFIASLRAGAEDYRRRAAAETAPGMRALLLELAAELVGNADSAQADFDIGGCDDDQRSMGRPIRRPGDRILDYAREARRHRHAAAHDDPALRQFHLRLAAACDAIAAAPWADPRQPPGTLLLPADFLSGLPTLVDKITFCENHGMALDRKAAACVDPEERAAHQRDAAVLSRLVVPLYNGLTPEDVAKLPRD